jgi:tetratricopeptide (TPR) repeat protein
MSPERWQKVREVFDQASECEPAEAERVLRAACGGDSSLYDEVRSMLAQRERSSPLDRAVWDDATLGVFHAGQTVAGRYRVVRYLNRGGMGEVYEARDLELDERVALKTLLPDVAADARMIARFKQEIQLSRKIGHPNVCRVFDLAWHSADGSSADTVFFLTMEFLDGETLAARLEREGRMSTAQALPLIEQMAQALDAAHAAGVIHRDFKPSNVMLTAAKESAPARAVVTDFGLARSHTPGAESTRSLSGRVMGTVDYMAPELLEGKPATFASDIYALGMVAYKLVTGVLPFASDTPLAAAILRSKEPIPSPRAFVAGLDPRWERAILRALVADPARRFTAATDFVRALRGESTAITLALPLMNRRKWIGLSAAVAVCVAGWLGWREWTGARRRPSPEAKIFYRKGLEDISAGAYFAATKALEETVKLAPHFALARARLAEAWVELEMPEKAQEQMLLARREDNSWAAERERLQIEAIDLTITREYAAAAVKYESMAKFDSDGSAAVALDLGRAYEKSMQPDKAVFAYHRAAEGPEHNPAAWLRLGVLYSRQSKRAQSEAAFAEAQRLYRLTSNLEGLAEVAFEQGVAANRRFEYADGAAYLQQALSAAASGGDVHQAVQIKLQLATNAYARGDGTAAEAYAREALDIAQANQLEIQAINGLTNLGNAYFRKQDFESAERFYERALDLAQRNHSARFLARSSLYLAALHDQQGRPQRVVPEVQAALPFFQANGYAQETFSCLVLLGRAERQLGNLRVALADSQRLLAAAQKSGNRSNLYQAHESLGLVLEDLEEYPEALDQYRTTLELSETEEHTAYAQLHVGRTAGVMGGTKEARAYLQQARRHGKEFPAILPSVTVAEAKMDLWSGDYGHALRLATGTQAGRLVDRATEGRMTTVRGLALLALGKKADGLSACEQAVRMLANVRAPESLLESRVALMQALIANGRGTEALGIFQVIEPELADHPEQRWRASELASRADGQYRSRAVDALEVIRKSWGAAFQDYLVRADIRKLSWPLLHAAPANR